MVVVVLGGEDHHVQHVDGALQARMEGRPPDVGRTEILQPAHVAQAGHPERGQEVLDGPLVEPRRLHPAGIVARRAQCLRSREEVVQPAVPQLLHEKQVADVLQDGPGVAGAHGKPGGQGPSRRSSRRAGVPRSRSRTSGNLETGRPKAKSRSSQRDRSIMDASSPGTATTARERRLPLDPVDRQAAPGAQTTGAVDLSTSAGNRAPAGQLPARGPDGPPPAGSPGPSTPSQSSAACIERNTDTTLEPRWFIVR